MADDIPAEAVEAAVEALPPTQYLVMEVLAARYRLGENCWTFPTRLNATIIALGEAGLVWDIGGNVPQTTRVMLTDLGKRAVLMDGYEPPAHKELRAQWLAERNYVSLEELDVALALARHGERARVLAEVDAALRDERFMHWYRDQPTTDRTYAEVSADYLRDVLGAGGASGPFGLGDPLPTEVIWECDAPGCDTPKLIGFSLFGGPVSRDEERLAEVVSEHYATRHPGFLEGTR